MTRNPEWTEFFGRKAQQTAESDPAGATVVKFPEKTFSVQDRASAALELVSEAAAAVRNSEERAAEMVARSENLANQAIERLRAAEARIQRAEKAQHDAEANLVELADALDKTRSELEGTQKRLSTCEAELAAAKERAAFAARRADDAEAAIDRIVDAIRAQLTITQEGTTNDASAVA